MFWAKRNFQINSKICVLSVLFLLITSLGILPTPLLAQDDDFTCDDGPNDVLNAAQAAFEAGNDEEALDLVDQALNLCTGGKRSQARRLRRLVESSLAPSDNAPSRGEPLLGIFLIGIGLYLSADAGYVYLKVRRYLEYGVTTQGTVV